MNRPLRYRQSMHICTALAYKNIPRSKTSGLLANVTTYVKNGDVGGSLVSLALSLLCRAHTTQLKHFGNFTNPEHFEFCSTNLSLTLTMEKLSSTSLSLLCKTRIQQKSTLIILITLAPTLTLNSLSSAVELKWSQINNVSRKLA